MTKLESQAFRLPVRERERLAKRLIESVDGAPLTEIEEAWVKEAERRFAAYRRGERKGVPAATLFRRIRKDAECRA